MKKTVLIYGLIAAAITIIPMTIFNMLSGEEFDFKIGEIVGYASMILALSTIFIAVRKYRDEELDGVISFGKAFQIGILITLVASTIYVTSWMIYSTTGGANEMMTAFMDQTIERLRADGATEAQVNAKIAEMESFQEMYKNPIVKIGITFLEIFPVGLIISLIAAGLLRKAKSTVSVAQ